MNNNEQLKVMEVNNEHQVYSAPTRPHPINDAQSARLVPAATGTNVASVCYLADA